MNAKPRRRARPRGPPNPARDSRPLWRRRRLGGGARRAYFARAAAHLASSPLPFAVDKDGALARFILVPTWRRVRRAAAAAHGRSA